jgi:hypothetical protein
MGRAPKVDHVRDAFIGEVDAAIALVAAIQAVPSKVRPSNKPGLHPKHAGQVVGLAFMGLVASWEEFIERTLVRYLAGAKTDSGYLPKPKGGTADDISHAYELLSLDPDYNPSRDYLKVTNTRWVTRTADFYFATHPYGCLTNQSDLLRHASSIRNRVAHDSDKCKADFKTTAIAFLHPPNDHLSQGYGPGALLTSAVQRHFGQPVIQAQKSHFAAYADLYKGLARKIVP